MLPENLLIGRIRGLLGDNKLFLVGGSVRDLVEKRSMKDYDFLIEGDVFTFARQLSEKLNCKLKLNKRLMTASLTTAWGNVDIAHARQEAYAHPGALPAVTAAAWPDDLLRRDFSVNALALPLLREGWGEIIDPAGGLRDIDDKLIRILHENSFRDDPSRLLRALRLKWRLGYRLEEKTAACLKRDWPYLEYLSPARRLKEWQLLCAEPEPGQILEDIFQTGGWTFFLPGVPYREDLTAELARIAIPEKAAGLRPWFLDTLALLNLSGADPDPLLSAWELRAADAAGIRTVLALLRREGWNALKSREQHRMMRNLPPEGVFLLYRRQFFDKYAWEEYYQAFLGDKMPVTGNDLLLLGISPGPVVGRVLAWLEDRYAEEDFHSKEEGIELARAYLKEGTIC